MSILAYHSLSFKIWKWVFILYCFSNKYTCAFDVVTVL